TAGIGGWWPPPSGGDGLLLPLLHWEPNGPERRRKPLPQAKAPHTRPSAGPAPRPHPAGARQKERHLPAAGPRPWRRRLPPFSPRRTRPTAALPAGGFPR